MAKGSRPRVRLYPTDHYYGGVAPVERLVDADVADRLLAVPHPAFTREGTPSDGPVLEDDADLRRELPELYQPAPAAPAPVEAEAGHAE